MEGPYKIILQEDLVISDPNALNELNIIKAAEQLSGKRDETELRTVRDAFFRAVGFAQREDILDKTALDIEIWLGNDFADQLNILRLRSEEKRAFLEYPSRAQRGNDMRASQEESTVIKNFGQEIFLKYFRAEEDRRRLLSATFSDVVTNERLFELDQIRASVPGNQKAYDEYLTAHDTTLSKAFEQVIAAGLQVMTHGIGQHAFNYGITSESPQREEYINNRLTPLCAFHHFCRVRKLLIDRKLPKTHLH